MAPPAHDWSTVVARAERDVVASPRSRWLVAGAATAIVVLGIGALLAVNSSDGGPVADAPTITTTASATPTPAVTPIDYVVLVDGAPVGDTWVTGLAADADQLAEMWDRIGLDEPAPSIDFGQQVVVYFGPAESSSCPFLPIAGVSYSTSTGRLYPDLPIEAAGDCTSDANPHAVVVAIDRAALPVASFDIWVDNDDPPACCANNVTTVPSGTFITPVATLPPTSTTATTVPGSDAVPTGTFSVGADDLFIVHADGDLWLHPGILGDRPGEPIRVADFDDPRTPVSEGDGPNVVQTVAGVYDGSLLFSDCCEPAAGNIYALPSPNVDTWASSPLSSKWSDGDLPSLSPDGQRLVRLHLGPEGNELGITALDGTSRSSRPVSDGNLPEQVAEHATDVAWSDDDEIAALVVVDASYELRRYTADASMDLVASEPIAATYDPDRPPVSIAGGFNGTVVLAITDTAGTRVEYHTAGPASSAARQLPGDAHEVRVRQDGAIIWVDGDTLWYQPSGAEPHILGSGFTAAWFATS